jgi:Tol biopolymer transport system component
LRHNRVVLLSLAILLLSFGTALSEPGEPVKLAAEKEGFICPLFSPDGASIAMTREGWAGIWRMDPDGTGIEELTAESGAGYRFAWSPDGGHIAYRAERLIDGKRHFAIRLVDVSSGHIEELTEFERYLGSPRWVLGDGTVAFEADRTGALEQAQVIGLITPDEKHDPVNVVATTSRDLQIWVSDPYGDGKTLVSGPDERCFAPIISPRSEWICYTSLDHGGSIAVARPDGSERKNLGFGSNPSWSPDGRRLVCEVTRDDGHAITGSDLFIIEVESARREQLTDTPEVFERWPSWSPDGSRILCSAAGAIYSISVAHTVHAHEEEAP